jgi:Fibronectin type III domain
MSRIPPVFGPPAITDTAVAVAWSFSDTPRAVRIYTNPESRTYQDVVLHPPAPTPNSNNYTWQGLNSGTLYTFTIGLLYDADAENQAEEIDGSFSCRTTGPFHQQPGPGELPVPTFVSADPIPATIRSANGVKVTWTSSHSYDKYHVLWGDEGQPDRPGVELDSGRSTESFTIGPTVPGAHYHVSVQGCDGHLLGDQCSGWAQTAIVAAGPNLRSLRQFLMASGLQPGGSNIRQLAGQDGGSLRRMLNHLGP